MKVLVVHNFYQSKMIGGEDLVVHREIKGLQAALGEESVFQYHVRNDDIHPIKLMRSIWGDESHATRIAQLVKQHAINIVHVHNFFPLLTPLIFESAKKAGAKVIHTLHNYRNWCLSGLLYREDKPWCLDCVNRKFMWPGVRHGCYRQSKMQSAVAALAFGWYRQKHYFDAIDFYFALTEFQKNLLIQLGLPAGRIVVKPNGIEYPRSKVKRERAGFLYVGRLEKAKGIDDLLAIWKDLDYPLWVIGGPQGTYASYQHPKVTFLGQLSHNETIDWMGKVKYLIHPAQAVETFGLTMIEAMAQGTPVIGLNRGTRLEFIIPGQTGFRGEPNELKQLIIDAEHYSDYTALSERAARYAERFYIERIIQEQISWYHNLKLA
ncbi:MAG: glycosyltransferase [Gammaproteobacteria bacterium]